ncbi:MAG: histidinol-phosphatase [Lentisphaeria bacterium]|nr:histidinol-phosphatase [Lentisphaeria bacterium]
MSKEYWKLTFPGAGKTYSLHNHSEFSDGSGTLREICLAAKSAGIKVFGLSDHWVEPPEEGMDSESWAMDTGRLDEYTGTLLQLKRELDDDRFTLKIGLEVDFFFENIDAVLKRLADYPLDYLIGSVHYAGIFPVDYQAADWLPLSDEEKSEICRIYWEKLLGAAERKEFTFLGHLDLPKKFGLIDNGAYFPQAVKVLDVLAGNGGAIEVNTAGFFKECHEQYPAIDILKAAFKRKIPVVVNADAHSPEHLQRNFPEAYQILQHAGYPVME